ncbi:SGNH/GDSL hydrolase family protein [Methylorubrum aminovorans]
MPDPVNSVAVATGSPVVSGYLTAFVAAEFDLFMLDGMVVAIDARESDTRIRLKKPWPGTTRTGVVNWEIVNTGPYWQSNVALNRQLQKLLNTFEAAPFRWDVSGPFSERASYNNQPKGFSFLSIDPLPFTIYVKQANTNNASDWSAGQVLQLPPEVTAQAVAARDAAVQAADIAAGAQPNQVVEYPTVAAAQAANIPAAKLFVRVAGRAAAGDQGTALYKKVAAQPTHSLFFRSADGAYWELTESSVRLQQLGGADNGSAGNDTAWAAIKSAGRRVALPKVSPAATYLFSTPLLLNNAAADPEPGVSIRCPGGADFSPTFRTTRSLPMKLRIGDGDTVDYNYELTPDFARPRREKVAWPEAGDINRDRYEMIDPRTMRHVAVTINTDNIQATVPKSVTDRDVVYGLTANSTLYASLLPVRGGQDIRWARGPGNYPGAYGAGVFIHTTAGYYYFYAYETGNAVLGKKMRGVGTVNTSSLSWPGLSTDGLFFPGMAYWGVRIYNNKSFAILINGYKAFGSYAVEGEIIEAGPLFISNRALDAGAGWINRVTRAAEAGGALAKILCIGDSLTETIHGGWPEVMVEALDGCRGIRITGLDNYAVGGHAVFQQQQVLETKGIPAGTTHAAVMVGANDFAGSASTDDFTFGYFKSMLDMLFAYSLKVLVMIPFGSYSRARAGGRGANVTRPMSPSRTQMMLAAYAASRGAKVLDMNDVTGPLTGDFAAHAFAEPMLRDNVHPSAFGYKVLGLAAANAMLDLMIEPMSPEVIDGTLPTASLANVYGPQNGWTQDTTDGLFYHVQRLATGIQVSLTGQLKPGTRAAAALIYLLPPNLRPNRNITIAAFSDANDVTIQATVEGFIYVRGMQAAGSYVRLDGLNYAVR